MAAAVPLGFVVPSRANATFTDEARAILDDAAAPSEISPPAGNLFSVPVRVLTASHASAIESGFDTALSAFISEGHEVEIRAAGGLHDRHIIFNDRCWLVGGSLKDAGKKP